MQTLGYWHIVSQICNKYQYHSPGLSQIFNLEITQEFYIMEYTFEYGNIKYQGHQSFKK